MIPGPAIVRTAGTGPEVIHSDASQLQAALRNGDTTAREALESCLERTFRLNQDINAIIHMEPARARKEADECDRLQRAGHSKGPLHGIPVTVKECFDWEGRRTHWGDPDRKGNFARASSTVVDRLEGAGAIVFGKTNIPAYLGDWETWNPLCGETRNPHDCRRGVGGSSGGSAAAVASGMSYADIGSDLGGSIRLPAHYCGVFGLKPSWGLIPMRGHSPLCERREPDIGVAGPITRSARDAAAFLKVLIGPASPGSAWRIRLRNRRPKRLRSMRIGVLLDHELCPVDSSYLDRMERFADALALTGAEVSRNARPAIDLARHTEIMNLLVRAETSTRPSLDPARTPSGGIRGDNGSKSPEPFSGGADLSHREWLELQEERLSFAGEWDRFFADHDLLICPSGARTAPLFEMAGGASERTVEINGTRRPVVEQHLWFGLASLPGIPAMSMPMGDADGEMPAGVQLIAAKYSDLMLCSSADRIHRRTASAVRGRSEAW